MFDADSLSVRIKCLLCMSKTFHVLDKWTVQERMIPCLQMIPSREPGVLMSMLGVFHEMINCKYVAPLREANAQGKTTNRSTCGHGAES